MSGPRRNEPRAAYGLSCHPDALSDLRWLPDEILKRALRNLERAVRGEAGVLRPLEGVLAGLHKIYLDRAADWRLVVQIRPTLNSAQDEELFLVAAGPRRHYAVYRDAQIRLHRANPRDGKTTEVQAAWARARSPQGTSPSAPC